MLGTKKLWEKSLILCFYTPKDLFVCPKISGLPRNPRTNPILFGWDWGGSNPIRSRRGSGFLGALIRIRQTLKTITLNKLSCSLHTFLSTLKVNSWFGGIKATPFKTSHDCDAHVWSLLLMDKILHQLIGSLSHSFQSFRHPRWCRISSINSSTGIRVALKTPNWISK